MVGWKRVERGFELVSDLGTAQDIQRVRAVDAAEEWDIRLIDVPILVQLGLTPRARGSVGDLITSTRSGVPARQPHVALDQSLRS